MAAKTRELATTFDTVLAESRRFDPPPEFAKQAHIPSMERYRELYARAASDPAAFWGELARERLVWRKPFSKVMEGQLPEVKWFADGELNVTETCLDRHLREGRQDRVAIIWEGEPGDQRRVTYGELADQVGRMAAALRRLGVEKGDRVCIYLPMIPEAAVAMLACARLGATHSVVFGGFSAEALGDRIRDAGAKVVLTADGAYRRGSVIPLKAAVDQAVASSPSVEAVVVVKRVGQSIAWNAGKDRWWHELLDAESEGVPAVPVPSEHPLFILYTSGSTGKPKGMVHSTAGYLAGVASTFEWVFDWKESDVFWCTADIGWITGHSYVVYGPLANGATVLMYEGAPLHPQPDRFWELIAKHRVSIFYTAPTAIRTFLRLGASWPQRHDLSSLRLLGTVGEPINPEAWMWYRETIGGGRCPVVDTWWQTENGAILISPLPGATSTKPGSATFPLPGISARVVDEAGTTVPEGKGGYLVIDKPWPSLARTIHNDHERYLETYFSQVPGSYFTGDSARIDDDGYFWIMGRVDDVINVSGHRLGTMEVESALVSHDKVAEAAVVGRPDDVKGNAIVAFVTLQEGVSPSSELGEELRAHVAREIGALARPEQVRFADALPKTRSGKIMRRLLRDIAAGRQSQGDMSTLEDLSVLAALHRDEE